MDVDIGKVVNVGVSVSICDDIGLKCFDDATKGYLKSNSLIDECPSECVTSQYF